MIMAMANAPMMTPPVPLCMSVSRPARSIAAANNLLLAVPVFDGPQDAMIFAMAWTTIVVRCCNSRSRTDKRRYGEEKSHQNFLSVRHQFPPVDAKDALSVH